MRDAFFTGVLLVVAVLIRRHFVYALSAFGATAALHGALCAVGARGSRRGRLKTPALRLAVLVGGAATTFAALGLPFLSRLVRYDLLDLYASYEMPASRDRRMVPGVLRLATPRRGPVGLVRGLATTQPARATRRLHRPTRRRRDCPVDLLRSPARRTLFPALHTRAGPRCVGAALEPLAGAVGHRPHPLSGQRGASAWLEPRVRPGRLAADHARKKCFRRRLVTAYSPGLRRDRRVGGRLARLDSTRGRDLRRRVLLRAQPRSAPSCRDGPLRQGSRAAPDPARPSHRLARQVPSAPAPRSPDRAADPACAVPPGPRRAGRRRGRPPAARARTRLWHATSLGDPTTIALEEVSCCRSSAGHIRRLSRRHSRRCGLSAAPWAIFPAVSRNGRSSIAASPRGSRGMPMGRRVGPPIQRPRASRPERSRRTSGTSWGPLRPAAR